MTPEANTPTSTVDDDQTAPDDASWRRQLARLEDIPAGQLRDLAADVAMEAYLLGIEKEASRHTNAGKVVSPTGRPPRASAGASLVSGEYDEAAAHHDALVRQVEDLRQQLVAARQETARLRSQLAEARDALARVARTLGWDAPPEQVPSGIPDLTIAVQQLRHERDQARAVLAEARQQRDHYEIIREALLAAQTEGDEAWDRLRTLIDELASAMEMSGTPDDHEIIREARAFGQLRVELAALRAEREWLADQARTMGIADAIITTYGPAHAISAEVGRLRAEVGRLRAGVLDLADRVTTHAKGYGEPLEDVAADFDGIAEELRTLTADSTPDTGGTDG